MHESMMSSLVMSLCILLILKYTVGDTQASTSTGKQVIKIVVKQQVMKAKWMHPVVPYLGFANMKHNRRQRDVMNNTQDGSQNEEHLVKTMSLQNESVTQCI